MGHNLISICHKCQTKIFHFRNEENKTILPFYIKHKNCAKEKLENVVTVMDNNGTDRFWFWEETYQEDILQDKQ